MVVIGISGKKYSGKSTVARLIQKHYPNVYVVNFADGVKQEVAEACKVSVDYIERNKAKFRTILQWWGTDFRRNMCYDSYWTRVWSKRVNKVNAEITIAADVRFLNECSVVKGIYGGVVWRVRRDPSPYTIPDAHASETELDNYKFDQVIDNNLGIDELETIVCKLMEQHMKEKR